MLSVSLSLIPPPPSTFFFTPSTDPSLCYVLSWGKDKGEGDGTVREGLVVWRWVISHFRTLDAHLPPSC